MKLLKGQVALEFMLLIGFVSFIFVVFFLLIQTHMSERIYERNQLQVEETASVIKQEIDLASSSIEGYSRTFSLPLELNNQDYDIRFGEGVLVIISADRNHASSLSTREANGTLVKGINTIVKRNGIVTLNP